MSSQFEKRKAKSVTDVAKEIEVKRDDMRSKTSLEEAAVYTQTGYDVFTSDGGKSYGVAEIAYNPITGTAHIVDTFSISRLVALSYANQKQALGILKKQKKAKEG